MFINYFKLFSATVNNITVEYMLHTFLWGLDLCNYFKHFQLKNLKSCVLSHGFTVHCPEEPYSYEEKVGVAGGWRNWLRVKNQVRSFRLESQGHRNIV